MQADDKKLKATTLAASQVMLWRTLESYGVDARDLFERAGLDADAVRDPDARYPMAPSDRLWVLAVEAVADPALGLRLARHWHPGVLNALGFAWMASRSLRDAFARLERYWQMVLQGEVLLIEEVADGIRVAVDPVTVTDELPDAVYDAYLAVMIAMCRALCGANMNPLGVLLRRQAPAVDDEFRSLFRAPIQFGAPMDALLVGRDWLDLTLPTANAEVARASDAIVAAYLARLQRSQVAAQVRAKLIERLPAGECTESEFADALHLSRRTLQRRLRDEGTTFSQLLEQTRHELARQYLHGSRRSVGEVAYSLGFSEVSNFSRAFKRWTGLSPSNYRQRVLRDALD